MRALALLLLTLAAVLPTAAAEMTFFMKNEQSRAVAVEFYGRDRDIVWPGGDKVYLLEALARKSIRVTCDAGERICWGAWLNGDDSQSFGVGFDGQRYCESCCRVCADSTTETIDIAEDAR